MKRVIVAGVVVVAAMLLMVPGASFYYEAGGGANCTRCHEMNGSYDLWHASSHREIGCAECHGGAFTADAEFHWNNASRVYAHWKGEEADRVRLRSVDLEKMVERCKSCHRQEYAQWEAGPHSSNYARLFLDKTHNADRPLRDDCLRCHGMHFEGGIRELVEPVDGHGPWRLVRGEMAERAAIPCLACHGVHREGPLLKKASADGRVAGPVQEVNRPSLAFYDRRSERHVPVDALPLPAMVDGDRAVKMSSDRRQALCYQCHAAEAGAQVGSGDDRTPMGVHEGISCLSCHLKHGQKTRASCAECHPKMSNCGLDVEKMDTTFRSAESKHNIHWVKCLDCHPKGVPGRK